MAGFLDDVRTGRGSSEVVVGRIDASDPEGFADTVTDLHLAARRWSSNRPAPPTSVRRWSSPPTSAPPGYSPAARSPARKSISTPSRAFAASSKSASSTPLITAVVCVRDAADVLEPCLRSLLAQRYPRVEVLVVDDGSSDQSAELARHYGVAVVASEGRGLSAARNTGARAARGEIVAYIDADAEAHPDCIAYLWRGFERRRADGVGGPNLPFDDAGLRERAVSGAPGAPVPVVNPGGTAEHLTDNNMAFRRSLVLEVGFEETGAARRTSPSAWPPSSAALASSFIRPPSPVITGVPR